MKRKTLLLLVAVFIVSVLGNAQNQVVISHKMQRFIGDVSELNRSKYFNFHSNNNTDPDIVAFKQEYGIAYGRGFWGAFSDGKRMTGEVGVYPSYVPGSENTSIRAVKPFIATEHPKNVARWNVPVDEAANWAVEYYLDKVDDNARPEFFEPMNEPFVHAGDADFSDQQPDDQLMRERMADWFGAIGEAFDNTPELANMKVIGYSSAWPSLELWDFGHWDTRMKMFMDRAGEHMDAFATHLYDGINVTGQDSKRSGSNSEAILDLIETYSYTKWGVIKPHAISEFGGIEKGYGDNYSDAKSVQTLRSINHILINLLERENNLALAIPFIGDKALWHINAANNYQPYGSVLWRPKELGVPVDSNTEWVFTPRKHFFDLWKNVSGQRVYHISSNPDIQSQAFVNGSKLYVVLSNLDEKEAEVSLKHHDGLSGLQNVRIKRLKIFDTEDPIYTDEVHNTVSSVFTLVKDETMVLEYVFDQNIEFTNTVRSKKYYTSKHLQQIQGAVSFNFNDVITGQYGGSAYLRMSIGRKHDKTKKPKLTINGKAVQVPDNWAGYDQANRDDFFGMINIPIPYEYLNKDNEIVIEFSDFTGRISSVILQVEQFENSSDVSIGKGKQYGVSVYPTLVKNNWLKADLSQEGIFNKASIISMTGNTIAEKTISTGTTQVRFEDLKATPGLYMLRLTGKNALFTQKLIVQ